MATDGEFKDGCLAVVAVKARRNCKSRLAGRLAPESRVSLVRLMLNGVLEALRGAHSIGRIVVVSPERDTVPRNIRVLTDPGDGLNPALDSARPALVEGGATELLILPADLPLVTADDIDLLVARGRRIGFALASDAAGTGTNALYVASPAPFRFRFGPASRFHHLEEAARLGLGADVLRLQGLEFDLDGPADLALLLAQHHARYDSLDLLPGETPTGVADSIALAG
jgi:2-phospho-L-lactate guanylyltransferase